MIPGLQQVVDSLSARLERSVTIDDTRLNVLAYSIVNGQVDPMRTDAILHRATPTASAEWLFSLGITRATGPVRLPGRPEFGQLPRVCVPVRTGRSCSATSG
ncbi:hypothetical protein [Tenggerimyces flavus]|uniref:Uncharacterized protein n=1 Tax=Tenggerimyces flavus TaxID=1708749 RepID=A0ABV7YLB2_9ACTN|nr:hypothetical protein [Tenggerimyces flavus]MBM7785873.1 hypothetical protein [Tenggerimyces flavus]